MGVTGYGASAFYPTSSRRQTQRRLLPPVRFTSPSASTMPDAKTSSQGRIPPERWDVNGIAGGAITAAEAPTLETQGTPDLVGGILGFIGKAAEWGISLPNTLSKPLFGGEKGFIDVTAEVLDKTPVGDVARGLNTVFDTSSRLVGVAGNSFDMMMLRQTANMPESALLPEGLDVGADPIGAAITTLAQVALTPMTLANLDKAVNRQGMTVGQFRDLMTKRGVTPEQLQDVMSGKLGAYDPSLGNVRMFDDGGVVGQALDMYTRLAFDPLNLAFGSGGAALRVAGAVTHGIGLENAAKAIRVWDAATSKPAREAGTILATGGKTLAEGGDLTPTMKSLARYAELSKKGAVRYTQASIGIGATAAAGEALIAPFVSAEQDKNGWAHQIDSFLSDVLNDRPLSESSAFLVLSGVGIPLFPAVGEVAGRTRGAYRSFAGHNLSRAADIAFGKDFLQGHTRAEADSIVGWAVWNIARNEVAKRPSFAKFFVGEDGGAPGIAQTALTRTHLFPYIQDQARLMVKDGRINAHSVADELKRYDQYSVAGGRPLESPRPFDPERAWKTWIGYSKIQDRVGGMLDPIGAFLGVNTSTTVEILDSVMDDMSNHAGASMRVDTLIDTWLDGGTLDQKIKRLAERDPEFHKEIMDSLPARGGTGKRKNKPTLTDVRAAFLREFEKAGVAPSDMPPLMVSRDYVRTMLDRNAGIREVDLRMGGRTPSAHDTRGVDFARMSYADAPADMPYAAARARLLEMRKGRLMPDFRETFHEMNASERAIDSDVMPPEATPETFAQMVDDAMGPEQAAYVGRKVESAEAAYAEADGYDLPGAPGVTERLTTASAKLRAATDAVEEAERADAKIKSRNAAWMPPSPKKAKSMQAVRDAYAARDEAYAEYKAAQAEAASGPRPAEPTDLGGAQTIPPEEASYAGAGVASAEEIAGGPIPVPPEVSRAVTDATFLVDQKAKALDAIPARHRLKRKAAQKELDDAIAQMRVARKALDAAREAALPRHARGGWETPWTQEDLLSANPPPKTPPLPEYPFNPTAFDDLTATKVSSAKDVIAVLDDMKEVPGVNDTVFRATVAKGVAERALSARMGRMTPARFSEIVLQLAWENTHGRKVTTGRVAELVQSPKPLPLEAAGLHWDESILGAYDDGIFTEHDLRDAAPAQRIAEEEFGGRYAVKIRPKDALLYSEVSQPLPEGYLRRSTLAGLIFENPVAHGLERMTHAMLAPVANQEIARFARQAWESELVGKYNATPEELKRLQVALSERLSEKTLNRTGMLMFRGILSLPIGEIKAVAEKTLDRETLLRMEEAGDTIDRLLDRGANRFIRNLHERAMDPSGKGRLAAAESFLAGAGEKVYRGWQATMPGGAVRNISKTYYFLFRFALDPRWWLMNGPETDWLAGAQYGTYATRINGAQRQLPGVAFKQLEAGKPVRPNEMTVQGEFLISQDSGATMHVRQRLGFQSRIIEGDGGKNPGLLRKNIDQYINDIVPKTLDDLADLDPNLKMLVERFGKNPETWSNQLYDMLYQYDMHGVEATVKGAAKKLSKEEKAAAAAGKITEEEHLANIAVEMDPRWNTMLDRLTETNRNTFNDVTNLLAGNMNRSNAERVLNSYWLYWPISYQIKATRWLLRTMMKDSALGPNASGAVRIEEIRQTHIERMKVDQDYANIFEKNPTLWFAAQMIVPVTPWDIGVSLSRLPRYLGAWAGVFPEYETVPTGDIISAAQQMTKLGPLYTLDLLRRIQTEAQRS